MHRTFSHSIRLSAWAFGLLLGFSHQSSAHLISLNTGSIVVRDTDIVVMISARKDITAPVTSEAGSPPAAPNMTDDPINIFRSNFTFEVNNQKAELIEDMLLNAKAHDNQPAQVDWMARLSLPSRLSEASCIRIAVNWLHQGELLSLRFKSGGVDRDIQLSFDKPIIHIACD